MDGETHRWTEIQIGGWRDADGGMERSSQKDGEREREMDS